MNLPRRLALVAALFLTVAPGLHAQGTKDDYQRAGKLPALLRNKVFRDRVEPHWLADNTRFWYRNDLADGAREFVLVDAGRGTRQLAFDHARLASALGKKIGQELRAERLPLDSLTLDEAGTTLRCGAAGKRWEVNLTSYSLRELGADESAEPTLAVLDRPQASDRTGPETWITFVNRTQAPVEIFWIDADGELRSYATLKAAERHRQHTFAGHVWLVKDASGGRLAVFRAERREGTAVIHPAAKAPAGAPVRPRKAPGDSPDGKWSAFLKEHNIYLRNRQTGAEVALSKGATADDGYELPLLWSPDAQKLVALRTRKAPERKAYIIESSPRGQVVPRLHSFEYRRPGDPIPVSKPHLFDVATLQEIAISDALFSTPWSITQFRWEPDSKRFTFVYNQRGHQVLRIIAVDARTGQASAVVDEQSKTFIDYNGKFFVHYLDATGELLWMSERDGWNHLYLIDARSGRVKNQVTRGPWLVRGVERVDAEKRQVWFRAGGIHPAQDPYHVHFARVNLDGSGLALLTQGDGTHAIEYSPDGRFLIDTYSRVDLPPVSELRRASDGGLVCELEKADIAALQATGWQPPERFVAKGRDGVTDIHGVIFRPSHFDPSRSYPVIEEIYAGPQGAFVPKQFRALHAPQTLAELGFIVVKIDGMGTAQRSKAFHDVCWKNLGDAGLPDRVLWIKAAAARYRALDLTRVGIYGTSAGGQSALRALLTHPGFYKVAVAVCGCHDNEVDKIWWNELWMGWPLGPHYREQSNVTQAHKLQGKLLLIVGELDRNVDPASTMQVVNALVKADKDFDLLVIPGGGHGLGGPYGARRLQDFFVRHLLGVEPRNAPVGERRGVSLPVQP